MDNLAPAVQKNEGSELNETIRRVVRLLLILRHGASIEFLADRLEVSPRGVYRYLAALKSVGIPVEKLAPGRYGALLDAAQLQLFQRAGEHLVAPQAVPS